MDEHGQKINPWQFDAGRWLEPQGVIRFPVRPDGVALDFSWAAFNIPVVSSRFVQLFERMGLQETQFLPVQVENHPGPWSILNTLSTIRCIDDARCEEVQYWRPEDGQPEKVGQYQSVAGLRIDPTKVEGARIFRPWGWSIALLVSEDVKDALEREGLTGPRFTEV
ncbi:imm11 family protein [Archangium sp.]|uniref:imm11 family protein n=1 Tax=Archangium sp. TaxID=1872627 RepID=UPI0038D4097D